ncbi:MAG TPA: ATP-binding cassette domain-containing protein [Candidatus Methanoperedens sp.]|nr:ATP-binding cassette domain-containing protein [Candidatus Methanoperedens sp.]
MKKGEIILDKVSKIYESRQGGEFYVALDNINLKIKSGDRIGLIGCNGSGKTTLLKLIAGIAKASRGEVRVEGKVNSLLEIGAGFHPDLSGIDNIMLNGLLAGMSRNEVLELKNKIVEFSDLGEHIGMPFYTYSSGMKLKLAFSVAVAADPDILIFDEVVSMGDEKFIKMFKDYFSEVLRQRKTVLFATHVLEVLSLYCDKTIWMDKGRVRLMGKTDEVIKQYRKEYGNE